MLSLRITADGMQFFAVSKIILFFSSFVQWPAITQNMCAACMIFFDLSVGALHFASVCTDLLDDVTKFG